MYRKRHQKRGGFSDFFKKVLEQAKEKASGLMDTMDNMKNSVSEMDVGQSTQSGSVKPNLTEAIMVSNDQNIPPVQEGGKSRRKKRKRTKRRSSVRQRR
jgi:hypothetical protein